MKGGQRRLLKKITKNTKAIFFSNTGYYRSKILENDEELSSVRCPITLLDSSCIAHSSSLSGREAFTKKVLNSRSKLPVAVSPKHGIFMFPTLSKRNKNCVWLSYYHIKNFYKVDDRSLVNFTDGTSIYVQVSESILDTQFKRTSQLIAQIKREQIFGPFP